MGSDQSNKDICDGKGFILPAQRKAELDKEALDFNLKLQSLETKDGTTHVSEVEAVEDAFWLRLDHAHNAERRELVTAVDEQSQAMHKDDPAMPTISYKMQRDSYLEDLEVHYPMPFYDDKKQFKGYYTYLLGTLNNGVDMDPQCRASTETATETAMQTKPGFSFTLPTFSLFGKW